MKNKLKFPKNYGAFALIADGLSNLMLLIASGLVPLGRLINSIIRKIF